MTHSRTGRRERGAILIVTLLFLVILTMLGITAMSGTSMEERMAGNTRDVQTALQAADAALRDARRDFSGVTIVAGTSRSIPILPANFGIADPDDEDKGVAATCNTGDSRGLCLPANNPDGTPYEQKLATILPSFPKHDMADTNITVEFGQYTGAPKIGGKDGDIGQLARQPRYVIEIFCLQEVGISLSGPAPACRNYYRVTARGYGRNPNTQVTAQEMFAVQN